MKRTTLFFGAASLAAIAAIGFLATRPKPAPTTAPAKTEVALSHPAITVAPIRMAVLHDRVRASGLVGAVEQILIQPQVEGQAIDAVKADVGDQVKTGDILAVLSETSLKLQRSQYVASHASAEAAIAQANAQLIQATASADEANRARDRADQLKKQGNMAQAGYDQALTAATSADAGVLVATQTAEAAKAQLALVDAQIENVDLQLTRTRIIAPADGQIVEKNAMSGSIASAAGKPMFVLIRDGLLELNADVAEQDLPRLSVGMIVTMRAAGSGPELTGTVRLIEPAIDPVTRLGRVRIVVDQASQVRAGTFLEADIHVSDREVPVIPVNALGTDAEGSYVMAVGTDGKVHRLAVKTGVRDGGQVEITEGAAQGQMVVAKAASFVRDGDIVTPVTEAENATTDTTVTTD